MTPNKANNSLKDKDYHSLYWIITIGLSHRIGISQHMFPQLLWCKVETT